MTKKQKIIRKKSNSMGKGCREGSRPQIVLKTGKNHEKKQKIIRKKSISMGKGCREGSHLQTMVCFSFVFLFVSCFALVFWIE